MKIKKKAASLLKRIGKTDDCSLRLTQGNAKAANELKDLGLVEFIRRSQGGADICLNNLGVEEYNKLCGNNEQSEEETLP